MLTMAINFTEVLMMLTETLTLMMAMNFAVVDDDADNVEVMIFSILLTVMERPRCA